MAGVASRHAGTLNGRLAALDSTRPVAVAVEVSEEVSDSLAVQQTAWMVVNMLARLKGVVESVSLSCPKETVVVGRVSPLFGDADTFTGGVMAGAAAIDTVPVSLGERRFDVKLAVGPGGPVPDGLRVYGEGWCGGVSRDQEVAPTRQSSLPFGPYMAASLAVGDVFRHARIPADSLPPVESVFYSLWSHSVRATPRDDGPTVIDGIKVNETLAGVGAVGCVCAACLWATDGLGGDLLLVDGDKDGVDISNLNRYLLFGRRHLGMAKASTAKAMLEARPSGLNWHAHDGLLETAAGAHRRILCAVDTNAARNAVQSRWPESLLMASTHELRAEIVRCDPRNDGPCARCYNSPEVDTPDAAKRRQFLDASTDEQRAFAEAAGVTVEEASLWARTGACGTSGERVRQVLGSSSPVASFAVPFVSCAAGTMLAAEAVKEALCAPEPLSTREQRATVQFWRPAASSGAKPYRRDPDCPQCRPGSPAVEVWNDRVRACTRG